MDPLLLNPFDDEELPLTAEDLVRAPDGIYRVELDIVIHNYRNTRKISVRKFTNDGIVFFSHQNLPTNGFTIRYLPLTRIMSVDSLIHLQESNCSMENRPLCLNDTMNFSGFVPFFDQLARELNATKIVLFHPDECTLPDGTRFPRWYGNIIYNHKNEFIEHFYYPAELPDNQRSQFFQRIHALKNENFWECIKILQNLCPQHARILALQSKPTRDLKLQSTEFITILPHVSDNLLKTIFLCLQELFPFTGHWTKELTPDNSDPPFAHIPKTSFKRLRTMTAFHDVTHKLFM